MTQRGGDGKSSEFRQEVTQFYYNGTAATEDWSEESTNHKLEVRGRAERRSTDREERLGGLTDGDG